MQVGSEVHVIQITDIRTKAYKVLHTKVVSVTQTGCVCVDNGMVFNKEGQQLKSRAHKEITSCCIF